MRLTEFGKFFFIVAIGTVLSFIVGFHYVYDPTNPIVSGIAVAIITAFGLALTAGLNMIVSMALDCRDQKKNMPPRMPVQKQGNCGKKGCENCTSCHCEGAQECHGHDCSTDKKKDDDNENCIGCGYRHDHLR